jgi:hypothetical protein
MINNILRIRRLNMSYNKIQNCLVVVSIFLSFLATAFADDCQDYDYRCNGWGCIMRKDDTNYSGGGVLRLIQGNLSYWTSINHPSLNIEQHCTGSRAFGIEVIIDNSSNDGHGIHIDYDGNDGHGEFIEYDGDGGDGLHINYHGQGANHHGIYVENTSGDNAARFINFALTTPTLYCDNTDTYGQNSYSGYFTKTYGLSDVLYATGSGNAIHGYNNTNTGEYAAVFGEQDGNGYGIYGRADGAGYAVVGYALAANSVAGYFSSSNAGGSPCMIVKSNSNSYALSMTNEKTGSCIAKVARMATTSTGNYGDVLTLFANSAGNALVCSTKAGEGVSVIDYGGGGTCIGAGIIGNPTTAHDASLASFINKDQNNTVSWSFQIINDAPHGVMQLTAWNSQATEAVLLIDNYGCGPTVRMLQHASCNNPTGLSVEHSASQGPGIIVTLDSVSNDSNGIEVFHHGLGCGIYSEINNPNSTKPAIYGKVQSGVGKAGYFEGELQTTKRLIARGISAFYKVADITNDEIPCNDLAEGDLFVVENINTSEYYVAIKIGDKAGEAVKMSVDLKLKILNIPSKL